MEIRSVCSNQCLITSFTVFFILNNLERPQFTTDKLIVNTKTNVHQGTFDPFVQDPNEMELNFMISQVGTRGTDGEVDTVLNGGEHGNEHTDDEDPTINRSNFVHEQRNSVLGNQITDSVDDNCTQRGFWNVVESTGQTVQGQDHTATGENTRQRGLDVTFGLQGGSGEGPCSWVCVEESTDKVRDTNSDQLLVWDNLVVVDSTKGLGDGNVFQ
ncbi:hypothetical protein WICPIJ_002512 [Wickerhamomyces pijperi]|uniref:Uncharacterized protein n=1 Tax=Wickerhamomyces pijperi TaxID=599730 RepID=A0A9P8QBQ5_WICPI|nr:hypothetical protein WICPIJ_002512 [Wickerhamomyces pijperi]